MILQTLDIEDNCRGIFFKDQITLDPDSETLRSATAAWKHSPMLNPEKYLYLYVLSRGKPLETFLDNPGEYNANVSKIKAQAKAAKTAKINLQEVCFYDLMPKDQLLKYYPGL